MTHRVSRLLAVLTLLALAGTLPLEAQRPHTREGLWANLGVGWGSLGCDGCDERLNGGTGAFMLGGTLNQKWQLGGGSHVWTKSEDGTTMTVGLVSALARFYPSATGGFHVMGGLGLAYINVDLGFGFGFGGAPGSETETGRGILLGLGYDIRVGRNVSLTPFWNGIATWYDNGDLNFGQLGLGVTIH